MSPERVPLRVMTWNVWWRFGEWQRREKRIAGVVKDTAPDLLGLQEVWGVTGENQAQRLANQLGMYWVWAPSPVPERFQRQINDPTVDVGNAILSRWPIVGQASRDLPGSGGEAGRTAVLARVEAPAGAIAFVTTQLASAVGKSALRCEQVRALARFIADEAASGAIPILTGDLNAEPDSDEIRLLGGHKTTPPVPGLVLIDTWLYADPTAPPWTWDRRNPAVLATGEPNARIDYVLLGYRTASTLLLRIESAWLTGNTPIDDLWPSDHAAVVADLTWSVTS
jgi:endonuclease/exonuclease/phosphatase family metal-dependent hydrolase